MKNTRAAAFWLRVRQGGHASTTLAHLTTLGHVCAVAFSRKEGHDPAGIKLESVSKSEQVRWPALWT